MGSGLPWQLVLPAQPLTLRDQYLALGCPLVKGQMVQSFKPASDLKPARLVVVVNVETVEQPPLAAGWGACMADLCRPAPLSRA